MELNKTAERKQEKLRVNAKNIFKVLASLQIIYSFAIGVSSRIQ